MIAVRLFTHVDDVKETVEKIKKAGGKIVKDAWLEGEPAHTEMAFYKDTEGNVGGILRWITMGLQPKSPDA
jgi:predicted enzyme related to lactoylglutathione lyase